MPEHVSITDPNIHEPKGVATATAGDVYVADGAGSGTWKPPELDGTASATVNQVFLADGAGNASWQDGADKVLAASAANKILVPDGLGGYSTKTMYLNGFEDYNHSGTTQAIGVSTWTKMLNDAGGAFTNKTYQIPGFNDLWDTINNQLDFDGAGLQLGDTVDFRVDLEVTTTVTNQIVRQGMDLAVGSASPYRLVYGDRLVKTAGTVNIARWISVYMGDNNTLQFPAEFVFWSDAACTLTVGGWYLRINPRNPVLV